MFYDTTEITEIWLGSGFDPRAFQKLGTHLQNVIHEITIRQYSLGELVTV